MARPEQALSPEEMGLPKEEEKDQIAQGYSEQDAHNLEEGINKLVEDGLLDQDLAQRQIEDIRAKTSKVVEPGKDRDRFAAAGEISTQKKEKARLRVIEGGKGKEEEIIESEPEKAEILGAEYERKVSYEDLPALFETLDDTKEMGLLDDSEVKRQKLELITKLQEQSGWRLLENENLQKLLSEEKFSKDELQAVIDNVKESYNPNSDRWSGGKNYEEIDKALAANVISKEQAKQEKLKLISGVESSIGGDLSGARELLEMDQLNAEEFEAMTADAVGKVSDAERIKAERKRLSVEPVLLSDAERDQMFEVIDGKLDNIAGMSRQKLTKEERKIMESRKAEYKGLKKEIELNYNIVDTKDIPSLVRNGELSPERARDMLGDDLERTQKTVADIEKAVRYRELKLEDGAVARGYSMIDQLNAAGKVDFKSADLITLKNQITELGSKLYQGRKKQESKSVFGRMGDYFRTRFTTAGKKEVEALSVDQVKFAQLLQQRAEMESKFWSVARMPAEDQDILVKHNIFERKQTEQEEEIAGLQVFPQQVEKAMQEIMVGKTDPSQGLEKIKQYREIAEKRAEEFAMQEFDADQVKRAGDLIDQLFNKNMLSFNKANFMEALSRSRSDFTPPADKVKAREQLVAMEMEVYRSINNVSLSELGEALRAFREE